MGCYEIAFETGAVLGHAFRDRLTSLAKLFALPGREQELTTAMQELARRKLEKTGESVSYFGELAMFAEEERIRSNWRESGVAEAQMKQMLETFKLNAEQAFKNLFGAVSTGIGLGSAFPELTERLWSSAYERPFTKDEWQKYQRMGVVWSDDTPEPLPLVKRQDQILSLVELFVSKSRPELLAEFKVAGARI